MDRVALCGGCYSGKSTIAQELARQGYTLVNFTDSLKEVAARVLGVAGLDVTVPEIKRRKDYYRPFLQALGTLIGYDTNPTWVYQAFPPILEERMVFDNVRTVEQFHTLRGMGFELVYVQTSRHQRYLRSGLIAADFTERESHPIENNTRLYELASLVVNGTDDIHHITQKIIGYSVAAVA